MSQKGQRRLRARVRGVVQGVGFRQFVQREGRRLEVAGWVRNDADGSVAAVAEGRPAALEELLRSLRRGPPASRVESVEVEWLEPLGDLAGFSIRY